MDALLVIALEEVGLEGREGCSVETLWGLLGSRLPVGPITSLPPQLQTVIWTLLLQRTEDLHLFLLPAGGTADGGADGKAAGSSAKKPKGGRGKTTVDNNNPLARATKLAHDDPRVQDHSGAAALGVRLVASDTVRTSVLGVYEIQDSRFPLSDAQLAALEAVGRTRWRGTINADLANRLGIAYRNFHYIVKNLETRKLVVKNPVVFAPPGASVTVSSVLHLPRFQPAVKLGPGQMFKTVDAVRGMEVATYVLQDDNLYMRLVCSTIAETEERLVVESDLKIVCGFRGTRGHRLWRRLRKKLEEQGYLSFETCKVRERLVPCVRLLKDWKPPTTVEAEEAEGGGEEGEEGEGDDAEGGGGVGVGGRAGIQVAELSMERQLLDCILSTGQDGVLNHELFAKLGVSSKVYGAKLVELIKRYNIQVTVVNRGRAVLNRLVAPPELLAAVGYVAPPPQPPLLPSAAAAAAAAAAIPPAAPAATAAAATPAVAAAPAPLSSAPRAAAAAAPRAPAAAKARAEAPATAAAEAKTRPPRRSAAAKATLKTAKALKPQAVEEEGGDSEEEYTAADAEKEAAAVGSTDEEEDGSIGEEISDDDEEEELEEVLENAESGKARGRGSRPVDPRPTKRARVAAGQEEAKPPTPVPPPPAVAAAACEPTPAPTPVPAAAAAAAAGAAATVPRGVSPAPALAAAGTAVEVPGAAGGGSAKERKPHWTKIITLKTEDRLRLLVDHLNTHRFISRVQIRRLVMEWESAVSGKPIPTSGAGPDIKTIRRLMDRLAQSGKAKLIRVETPGFLGDNRPIDTLLRPDLEETPELLDEIRKNMAEFERKLRSDCCRKALAARKLANQTDNRIGNLLAGPGQAALGGPEAAGAGAGAGGSQGAGAGAAPAAATTAATDTGPEDPTEGLLRAAGLAPPEVETHRAPRAAEDMSGLPLGRGMSLYRAVSNEATARSVENGLIPAKMVRVRLLHFLIAKLVGLGGFDADPLASVDPAPACMPHMPQALGEEVLSLSSATERSRVAFAFGAMKGSALNPSQTQRQELAAGLGEAAAGAGGPGEGADGEGAGAGGEGSGRGSGLVRYLSVRRLWSIMPLSVALQVLGSTSRKPPAELARLCESGATLGSLPADVVREIMDGTSVHRLEYLISILRRLRLLEWAVVDPNHMNATRRPGPGAGVRARSGQGVMLLVHPRGVLEVPPGKELSPSQPAAGTGGGAVAGQQPPAEEAPNTAPVETGAYGSDTATADASASGPGAPPTVVSAPSGFSSLAGGTGRFLEVDLVTGPGLDEYWRRFEELYRLGGPGAPTHAEVQRLRKCFPATTVPEVLSRNSWHGQRLMTAVQWLKLQAGLDQIDLRDGTQITNLATHLGVDMDVVARIVSDRRRRLNKLADADEAEGDAEAVQRAAPLRLARLYLGVHGITVQGQGRSALRGSTAAAAAGGAGEGQGAGDAQALPATQRRRIMKRRTMRRASPATRERLLAERAAEEAAKAQRKALLAAKRAEKEAAKAERRAAKAAGTYKRKRRKRAQIEADEAREAAEAKAEGRERKRRRRRKEGEAGKEGEGRERKGRKEGADGDTRHPNLASPEGAADAARPHGSDSGSESGSGSENDEGQLKVRHMPSTVAPIRVRRVLWTASEDRAVLAEYIKLAAESGPHVRVAWRSCLAALPYSIAVCARHLRYLKRHYVSYMGRLEELMRRAYEKKQEVTRMRERASARQAAYLERLRKRRQGEALPPLDEDGEEVREEEQPERPPDSVDLTRSIVTGQGAAAPEAGAAAAAAAAAGMEARAEIAAEGDGAAPVDAAAVTPAAAKEEMEVPAAVAAAAAVPTAGDDGAEAAVQAAADKPAAAPEDIADVATAALAGAEAVAVLAEAKELVLEEDQEEAALMRRLAAQEEELASALVAEREAAISEAHSLVEDLVLIIPRRRSQQLRDRLQQQGGLELGERTAGGASPEESAAAARRRAAEARRSLGGALLQMQAEEEVAQHGGTAGTAAGGTGTGGAITALSAGAAGLTDPRVGRRSVTLLTAGATVAALAAAALLAPLMSPPRPSVSVTAAMSMLASLLYQVRASGGVQGWMSQRVVEALGEFGRRFSPEVKAAALKQMQMRGWLAPSGPKRQLDLTPAFMSRLYGTDFPPNLLARCTTAAGKFDVLLAQAEAEAEARRQRRRRAAAVIREEDADGADVDDVDMDDVSGGGRGRGAAAAAVAAAAAAAASVGEVYGDAERAGAEAVEKTCVVDRARGVLVVEPQDMLASEVVALVLAKQAAGRLQLLPGSVDLQQEQAGQPGQVGQSATAGLLLTSVQLLIVPMGGAAASAARATGSVASGAQGGVGLTGPEDGEAVPLPGAANPPPSAGRPAALLPSGRTDTATPAAPAIPVAALRTARATAPHAAAPAAERLAASLTAGPSASQRDDSAEMDLPQGHSVQGAAAGAESPDEPSAAAWPWPEPPGLPPDEPLLYAPAAVAADPATRAAAEAECAVHLAGRVAASVAEARAAGGLMEAVQALLSVSRSDGLTFVELCARLRQAAAGGVTVPAGTVPPAEAAPPAAADTVQPAAASPTRLLTLPVAPSQQELAGVLLALERHGLARRVGGWDTVHYLAPEYGTDAVIAVRSRGAEVEAEVEGPTDPRAKAPAAASKRDKDSAGDNAMDTDLERDNGAKAKPTDAVDDESGGAPPPPPPPLERSLRPWLDHQGQVNSKLWNALVQRVLGLVVRHPGIPENLLVGAMDVLPPQAARELLQQLVARGRLAVRTTAAPHQRARRPGLLGGGGAAAAAAAVSTGMVHYFPVLEQCAGPAFVQVLPP